MLMKKEMVTAVALVTVTNTMMLMLMLVLMSISMSMLISMLMSMSMSIYLILNNLAPLYICLDQLLYLGNYNHANADFSGDDDLMVIIMNKIISLHKQTTNW